MKKLSDLFAIEYGNKFDANKMTEDPDGVAFVTRSDRNNGVTVRVAEVGGIAPYEAGLLTVALGGSRVLATFVQQSRFYTAQNVAVLSPIEHMIHAEKLYWATCIRANRFRYAAFGREANRTLRDLLVPDEVPAWVSSIARPDYAAWRAPLAETGPSLPNVHDWKRFAWRDLFTVERGRYVPALTKNPGSTPSVSSTAENNGVSDFIDLPAEWPAGTITVARNGSIGTAFFQPAPYFATDDVHVLVPYGWDCTPARGLFICALIGQEKYRYSYGRKWSLEKMRDARLPLPTLPNGSVDWAYIDSYMAARSWSSKIVTPTNTQ